VGDAVRWGRTVFSGLLVLDPSPVAAFPAAGGKGERSEGAQRRTLAAGGRARQAFRVLTSSPFLLLQFLSVDPYVARQRRRMVPPR